MGTNYYWYPQGPGVCECCGQSKPQIHIGKASAGWRFLVHIYEAYSDGSCATGTPILSLDDWKKRWEEGEIANEYGDSISIEKMLSIILERTWQGSIDNLKSHMAYDGLQARYGGPTYDLSPAGFS